jgi:subtilase family serine protease
MTRMTPPLLKALRCFSLIAVASVATAFMSGQTLQPRIQAKIASAQTTTLKGTLHPLAQDRFDAGAMPTGTRFRGITLAFSRSAAQEAALQSLIAAQQNPKSPLYHKWLTPDEFAARFGMAQSDINKVEAWLQQQGFSIDSVARSRNAIHFSGTVGQINQAFGTQMHYYNVQGEQHFAPSTALSVPSAIAPVVLGIGNLNNFRPRSMREPRPAFTSSVSGSVFFAPGDIKVAYDVTPLVTGEIDGTGQSIVVAGQSSVAVSDIENFQSAAGLTKKDPTAVLVPGSGSSTVFSGDEGESDLDLEWSGAMAPGAKVFFVYTGSSTNYSVFDSVIYAVDQGIGDIITISYGACETELSGYNAEFESVLQQAATQGQTVLAASGDSGSSACYGLTGLTTAQQEVLDVSYPASSPNVTAVGGTEVSQTNSAYTSSGSAYWSAQGSTDTLTSALQYLPEVAWNDELVTGNSGLSASGGGVSTLFAEPAYQKTAGLTGTYLSTGRNVPDVSLYSSPVYVGYLYCTSDQSNWGSGQTGSCGSGFRASSSDNSLTVAGGTSFATPIFAGMVALINQKKGYTTGQGLLNTELYTLASNSTTYASAFHDTTTGNNECLAGSTYCSSSAGTTTKYTAGTGYDQVTGLGSVDLNNLVTAWPANSGTSASLIDSTTTVSASNSAPNAGDNVTFTVTVAPVSGSTTPTGSVTLQIDGGTSVGGTTVANQALSSSGTVTYTTSFSTAGSHQVLAQYSGDATFASSVGVAEVSVGGTSSGSGTFSLTASSVTVAQGASGSSTVKVTPASGYTGTVTFNVATSSSNLTNACYTISNATVTGTAAVTTSLVIYTNASDCSGAGVKGGSGDVKSYPPGTRFKISSPSQRTLSSNPVAPVERAAFGFLALILAGLVGWRFRKVRALAVVLAIVAAGFVLSGCGGGSSSSSTSGLAPKGTYTLTVTGDDSVTSTITASANMTLTVN